MVKVPSPEYRRVLFSLKEVQITAQLYIYWRFTFLTYTLNATNTWWYEIFKKFQWTLTKGRSLAGTPDEVGVVIQNTLESFAQKIPPVLMHRLWKRDGLDSFKRASIF